MTWVRKDDQMPIHRKVAPLSDAAYRLNDEAICWSSRNLTDGRIAAAELSDISKRGRAKTAAELVARQLWHPADYRCDGEQCPPPGPDGWVIHDYWEYQPSRERVLADRRAAAARQKRARDRSRESRRDDDRDSPRDSRVTGGVSHGPPVPARPGPSPEGGTAPTATNGRAPESSEPPPPRCPEHIDNPTSDPCGPCGDARRARNAWEADDARRQLDARADDDAQRRRWPRCARCGLKHDPHGHCVAATDGLAQTEEQTP